MILFLIYRIILGFFINPINLCFYVFCFCFSIYQCFPILKLFKFSSVYSLLGLPGFLYAVFITSRPHLSHIPELKVCSLGRGTSHYINRYPGCSGPPPLPLSSSTQAWCHMSQGTAWSHLVYFQQI